MARTLAALRVLVLLTRRDLSSHSTLALNNLFLCVAFMAQGSHSPRTAFWSTAPFLLLFLLPLLFVVSSDTLARFPPVRQALWPLTVRQRTALRCAAVAFNPILWIGALALTFCVEAAAAVLFVALALTIQICVGLLSYAKRRFSPVNPLQRLPALPGPLGGLVLVGCRQLGTVLDLYVALLLSVVGIGYRTLADHPQPDAYPLFALLIAVALSTYTQRMFGLDSRGQLERYRLLPLRGWQILLSRDLPYLLILSVLVLPLSLTAGLSFGLASIAVGRHASLRQPAPQKPWRFTAGGLSTGILQVIVGLGMGLGSVRVSLWFIAVSGLGYAVSLWLGDRWWARR